MKNEALLLKVDYKSTWKILQFYALTSKGPNKRGAVQKIPSFLAFID